MALVATDLTPSDEVNNFVNSFDKLTDIRCKNYLIETLFISLTFAPTFALISAHYVLKTFIFRVSQSIKNPCLFLAV